jgi:hypothetical protein
MTRAHDSPPPAYGGGDGCRKKTGSTLIGLLAMGHRSMQASTWTFLQNNVLL